MSPPRAAPERAWADTNVFVGLLAGPSHPLHEPALSLFRRVAEGELVLIVPVVIVAELAHVLRSILGWPRMTVAAHLGSILRADGLEFPERDTIEAALVLLADRPRMSFADAYLAALALDPGPPIVASFDRDLDGIEGVGRLTA